MLDVRVRPVSSDRRDFVVGRRWEAWRRGTEDFALLKACESAGVDKSVVADAVKSVLDAPDNPDAAACARERLTRELQAK